MDILEKINKKFLLKLTSDKGKSKKVATNLSKFQNSKFLLNFIGGQ